MADGQITYTPKDTSTPPMHQYVPAIWKQSSFRDLLRSQAYARKRAIICKLWKTFFGMNFGLICYSTNIFLKAPKNLTPGKPPPHPFFAVRVSKLISAIILSMFVRFAPSQRRFEDFKHQGIDWTLYKALNINILRKVVPSALSHRL